MATLKLSPEGRRYGYLQDAADARDFPLQLSAPAATARPALVDLEPWAGPKKNQGAEGSCAAHAGTGSAEWLARRFPEYFPHPAGVDPRGLVFSAAYLYYASRLFDGWPGEDGGTYGRSVCRVLNGKSSDVAMAGCCLEKTMPYLQGNWAVAPTAEQSAEAAAYRLGAYHRIKGGAVEVLECLASYPVLLGMNVYESFESRDVARTGVVPMPGDSELLLGGHEVLIIGYNDGPDAGRWPARHVKVRNSWGQGWGDGGDFYLPYHFLDDRRCTLDLWMQHLGKAW